MPKMMTAKGPVSIIRQVAVCLRLCRCLNGSAAGCHSWARPHNSKLLREPGAISSSGSVERSGDGLFWWAYAKNYSLCDAAACPQLCARCSCFGLAGACVLLTMRRQLVLRLRRGAKGSPGFHSEVEK